MDSPLGLLESGSSGWLLSEVRKISVLHEGPVSKGAGAATALQQGRGGRRGGGKTGRATRSGAFCGRFGTCWAEKPAVLGLMVEKAG